MARDPVSSANESSPSATALPRSPLQFLTDILFALPIRIFILFIVGLVLGAFIVDLIYPQVLPDVAKKVAADVGKEAGQLNSKAKILQIVSRHNLSWLYITDSNGRVTPATSAFAPDLSPIPKKSGMVDWKDDHFYESVSALGHDQQLHLGFSAGPILGPRLVSTQPDWTASSPPGYLSLMLVGLMISLVLALQALVGKPLWSLYRFAPSLLFCDDDALERNLSLNFPLTEVDKVAMSFRLIRAEFSRHEFERISKEFALRKQSTKLETEKEALSREFDEHVVKTNRNMSEMYTKESEEEFVNALVRELDLIQATNLLCQKTLDRLNDKFPTSITLGAFFILTKQNRYRLEASIGFDTATVEYLDEMDHHLVASEVIGSGKYLTIEKRSFKDYGLDQLGSMRGLHSAAYMPLVFQGKHLGMMAIYHDAVRTSANERLRIFRNVSELCSRELHRVIVYREELEAARTDALTGLYNKKFFYELVSQLFQKSTANPEEHPISFVMMDGDDFKQINDTYGHQIGDQMLKELATLIRECTRMKEYGVRVGRPKDYVIRYGGEEFLVVMENTSAGVAFNVAERIRKAIESKNDWSGGIARWTVSLGISTYPSDANNADELMLLADSALYYVKEELGKNKTCLAGTVPKAFRARKYSTIGGELGIFDPAALLQSIASARKSGVLTVVAPDGRKIWMLYEHGHPIQAKLGKFAGKNAIVEFVTTFDDGKFNFQEIQAGNKSGAGKKMGSLTGSFNIQKGLERCLMDAALAQDNYIAARNVIKDTNVYLHPSKNAVDFERQMAALRQNPEFTSEEMDVMGAIAQQIDDSSTAADIFSALDHVPTAVLWRVTSIMVKQGFVNLVPAEEHKKQTLKLKPLPLHENFSPVEAD